MDGNYRTKRIGRGRFYDIKLAFIMNSFQFRNRFEKKYKLYHILTLLTKTNVILKYYNTNNNANK